MRNTVINRLRCPKCAGHIRITKNAAQCQSYNTAFEINVDKVLLTTIAHDVPHRGAEKSKKENWSEWRRSNFAFLMREFANVPSEAVVLDPACGISPYKEDINDRYPEFISVDFDAFPYVDVVADITKPIPFENDTFDVVMLTNVLEHVPYPNAVLAECFRVLRPGGRIIGITPFMMGLHDVPYDFLRYTRHALGRYLQDAGFWADRDELLSTNTAALLHIQGMYFAELVQVNRGVHRILARTIRKVNLMVYSLIRRTLKDPGSNRIPQGYGWTAVKWKEDVK